MQIFNILYIQTKPKLTFREKFLNKSQCYEKKNELKLHKSYNLFYLNLYQEFKQKNALLVKFWLRTEKKNNNIKIDSPTKKKTLIRSN